MTRLRLIFALILLPLSLVGGCAKTPELSQAIGHEQINRNFI